MELDKASKVIGSILLIAGLGWSSFEVINSRPTHLQVSQSIGESDYIRYEDRIEELEEDKLELQFKDRPLTPRELKMIELYEKRIRRYEKRQERIVK